MPTSAENHLTTTIFQIILSFLTFVQVSGTFVVPERKWRGLHFCKCQISFKFQTLPL